jgi:hypothetical protein
MRFQIKNSNKDIHIYDYSCDGGGGGNKLNSHRKIRVVIQHHPCILNSICEDEEEADEEKEEDAAGDQGGGGNIQIVFLDTNNLFDSHKIQNVFEKTPRLLWCTQSQHDALLKVLNHFFSLVSIPCSKTQAVF